VLAEQAAQNAAEVEKAYGGSFAQRASNSSLHIFSQLTWIRNPDVESDQESWSGITSRLDLEREREHEYSDEEQLATVTVVEDFDPSALLHRATTSDDGGDTELPAAERRPLLPQPPPGMASRSRKDQDGPGKKKVVRYETKAARRATRATQRTRRTEKAERAGGKAARKNAGGKKPRARK
jgi:ribosomal RNA-processing protein 17